MVKTREELIKLLPLMSSNFTLNECEKFGLHVHPPGTNGGSKEFEIYYKDGAHPLTFEQALSIYNQELSIQFNNEFVEKL